MTEYQSSSVVTSSSQPRSAAGRAPSHFSNHEDRDARPVRRNVWLVAAPGGRFQVRPEARHALAFAMHFRQLRGFDPDLLHELRVLAKLVGHVARPQHAKHPPTDALALLIRKSRTAKGAGRVRLEDLPERELRVLLHEFDTKPHTCRVAGFDARDHLLHHRINPMPAPFRMLRR